MVPLHSLWTTSNNKMRVQFQCDMILFLFRFRSFTCKVRLLFHSLFVFSGFHSLCFEIKQVDSKMSTKNVNNYK